MTVSAGMDRKDEQYGVAVDWSWCAVMMLWTAEHSALESWVPVANVGAGDASERRGKMRKQRKRSSIVVERRGWHDRKSRLLDMRLIGMNARQKGKEIEGEMGSFMRKSEQCSKVRFGQL